MRVSLGTYPFNQPSARMDGVEGAVHPGGVSCASVRQPTQNVGVLFAQHQPAQPAVAVLKSPVNNGCSASQCPPKHGSFHAQANAASEFHVRAGVYVNTYRFVHRVNPHLVKKERGLATALASPLTPNLLFQGAVQKLPFCPSPLNSNVIVTRQRLIT